MNVVYLLLPTKLVSLVISQAEISRHMIYDREWEVYRILLEEGNGHPIPRNKIEEGVRKMLMGWE